eukprot:m.219769 g.219769  ORF g.219769 m.219769 type:complete len:402 (-) comp17236_c0_seq1:37-1242(-)
MGICCRVVEDLDSEIESGLNLSLVSKLYSNGRLWQGPALEKSDQALFISLGIDLVELLVPSTKLTPSPLRLPPCAEDDEPADDGVKKGLAGAITTVDTSTVDGNHKSAAEPESRKQAQATHPAHSSETSADKAVTQLSPNMPTSMPIKADESQPTGHTTQEASQVPVSKPSNVARPSKGPSTKSSKAADNDDDMLLTEDSEYEGFVTSNFKQPPSPQSYHGSPPKQGIPAVVTSAARQASAERPAKMKAAVKKLSHSSGSSAASLEARFGQGQLEAKRGKVLPTGVDNDATKPDVKIQRGNLDRPRHQQHQRHRRSRGRQHRYRPRMDSTADADDERESPSLEEMAELAKMFGVVAAMPADNEAAATLKEGLMQCFIAQAYKEYPEFQTIKRLMSKESTTC